MRHWILILMVLAAPLSAVEVYEEYDEFTESTVREAPFERSELAFSVAASEQWVSLQTATWANDPYDYNTLILLVDGEPYSMDTRWTDLEFETRNTYYFVEWDAPSELWSALDDAEEVRYSMRGFDHIEGEWSREEIEAVKEVLDIRD